MNSNILIVAAGTLVAMGVGTLARLLTLRRSSHDSTRMRRASLLSWWVVAVAVLLSAIVGRHFGALLFLVMSLLALREFYLLRWETLSPTLKNWACVLVVSSYLWLFLDLCAVFAVFLPFAALLGFSAGRMVTRSPEGYAASVSSVYWGLMLVGYAPAFAVLLYTLPPEMNRVAGGRGWFLFLLLLTEANDISQALIGRSLGDRRLAPQISPNKTWAGAVGGVCTSVLLAAFLSRWLTPWHPLVAALAGLLVALTGLMGDLNMSALKRDCHVKDSGNLLPGQGGVLDRIDSLIFTAPAFYGFVHLVHAMQQKIPLEIS